MIKTRKQNGLVPGSFSRADNKKGQTMILTVIILTGAILSATTIAALLVLFQLRQTSDIKASTQAIYAADTGIECILFEKIKNNASKEVIETNCAGTLLNGDISYVVASDEAGVNFDSVGRAGRAARAFEIGF